MTRPQTRVDESPGTEHGPLARSAEDRRAIWVMSLCHGIQHFYVAGLAVTYPFVVAHFHISYAVLGLWLTAAGVVGGILQASAGFVRRARVRVILTLQDLGMAAAAFLGAASPAFTVFGSARIGGAVASWPQHPVGSAYLSERFPRRRATALSWHTAGGSAGTAVVPLIASAVIATAGWRWALVTVGGALMAGAALVWTALPDERSRTMSGPDGAAASMRAALHHILGQRQAVAVLAAGTVAAGGRGLGVLNAYIPAYLRSGLHLSALGVGAIFTVVMVASIAGPVAGGMLADRFGRRRILIVTYLGGASAVAAFGAVGRHLAALVVTGLLVGVLAYAESPLLQALFADMTADTDPRAAFGVFYAIAYGVGALWTAIVGWLIDVAGFSAAFGAMGVSFVAAAVIIYLGIRGQPGPDGSLQG